MITLMMEAVCTSKTLVKINLTTLQYIPEDSKQQDIVMLFPFGDFIRFYSSRVITQDWMVDQIISYKNITVA
jgi:hypothetical protein